MAFRPPAGWIRHVGSGPALVKYTQPGEAKVPAELLITHLNSSNPTPLESFKRQARENMKEKHPTAKILEEKDLSVAGKQAFRLVFSENDVVACKTVVHRTNLEYYLLDAVFPPEQADKLRPLIETSVATLEIVPLPLNAEERAGDARTLSVLKGARIDPKHLGEWWYSIYLTTKKVGHLRLKQSESGGMYLLEEDVHSDFGEGNLDSTVVRGSYSPDGRMQKVDTEQTKINPKQKWVFRASASLQGGQAKLSRDMNGIKEERSFAVEEGVLLNDVAEFVRPSLVAAGKGSYLIKTLSPFVEEWGVESVDVGGSETLDVDGRSRNCILVQTYVGRRKSMTYFFSPDHVMIRLGGPKDLFSIRAATKEEAMK
jgi:hypothetical protein